MRYIFKPPVLGSVISIGGRLVGSGGEIELDDVAAARILRSSGEGCLVPIDGPAIEAAPAAPVGETPEESAARKAKRKARKEAARANPNAVPPEPSDDAPPEGEG